MGLGGHVRSDFLIACSEGSMQHSITHGVSFRASSPRFKPYAQGLYRLTLESQVRRSGAETEIGFISFRLL